ncbi:MAG: PAS domain S-box protein [Nitrospirales bacterium]|nr:PAS domain S-box protein [Nitrospira sp.]MDR4503076.1 PAS domain S-box protein [Nitrospirales bacterium]
MLKTEYAQTTPKRSTLNPFRSTLRNKITWMLSGILLGATLVVLHQTRQSYFAALTDASANEVRHSIERLEGLWGNQINLIGEDVRFLSQTLPIQAIVHARKTGESNPPTKETASDWKNQVAMMFTAFMKVRNNYLQIRLIGIENDGKELVRVDRQQGAVWRVGESSLQKKWHRSYMQETIRQPPGTLYYSPIDLNRENGRISVPHIPTLRVATPIHTSSGEILGIFIINYNMNELFSQMRGMVRAKQTLYLTNQTGEYLMNPDPKKNFLFEFGQSYTMQQDFPQFKTWLTSRMTPQLPAILSSTVNDHVFELKRLPFPDKKTRYMILGLHDSSDPSLILLNTLITNIGFLSVAVLSLICVAMIWLARFMSRKEHELLSIINTAPTGLLMTNEAGTIVLTNALLTQKFGYEEEELLGQSVEMLLPKRFRSEHPTHRADFFAEPSPRRMGKGRELYALRKDGSEFSVVIGITSLKTDAETLILTSVVDISDQKLAEARYRDLIQSNLLLMWTCRPTGECDFLNERWLAYTGKSADEQLGYGWLEQLHPDDRERVNRTWQEAVKNGSHLMVKFRIRCHDGSYRWFLALANPLMDDRGAIDRWVGCNIDIEEQHQAEIALQDLLQQNRHILESAGEGIWGLDLEGNATFVNQAAARMLGYQPEELIGKPMHTLVHHTKPDGSPYLQESCPMYTAFTEGTAQHRSDEYLWRKDGSHFPVSYTSSPNLDEHKRLTGAVVVFRDITEELEAKRMIAEKNLERTLILDNVPALVASFDRHHHYRFANKRYLKWFNITDDYLKGKHVQELLTSEVYTNIIRPKMDRALNGELTSFELQIPHANGHLRWVQATYVPDRDVQGVVHGLFAMVVDIHERKQFEAQLEEVTERLQLATQSAEIGVWDWDVTRNVLTWDERMYELYGVTRNTFAGAYEAWTNALHPDDHDRAHGQLQAALAGDATFNCEFRIIWPDQSIHHIRAFATVQRNQAGEAIRMIGVNWDITIEKLQEHTLTQYIDNLRRSNAELEQFAYVASHDLQEPLRKIRNFSELLALRAKGHLPQEAEKYLKTIVDGALRMQTLVQDLLAYSRVARGALKVESVDLRDVLKTVLENLDQRIIEAKGTITVGTLPVVVANRTQMEQLFQNLIGNGVKYRTDAPPVIGVSAERKLTHWLFSVRDNGIGIDPQYVERIFVIFQRLHTKQEYTGTGIGLAICKKIVELHGGDIWVESTPHQGSTFFFTLPDRSKSSSSIAHNTSSSQELSA